MIVKCSLDLAFKGELVNSMRQHFLGVGVRIQVTRGLCINGR